MVLLKVILWRLSTGSYVPKQNSSVARPLTPSQPATVQPRQRCPRHSQGIPQSASCSWTPRTARNQGSGASEPLCSPFVTKVPHSHALIVAHHTPGLEPPSTSFVQKQKKKKRKSTSTSCVQISCLENENEIETSLTISTKYLQGSDLDKLPS